jgi:hypothetical protein
MSITVVVVLVLALAALIWVAWACAPTRVDSTVEVPWAPERVIERMVLVVADEGTTDVAPGSTTLSLTHKSNAVWPIVVAVVLFPFGLLALAFRTTERAVIVATPAGGGGSYVTMRGQLRSRLFERIDAELQAMRGAPTGPPPTTAPPSLTPPA